MIAPAAKLEISNLIFQKNNTSRCCWINNKCKINSLIRILEVRGYKIAILRKMLALKNHHCQVSESKNYNLILSIVVC